jgi:hypothetical protein
MRSVEGISAVHGGEEVNGQQGELELLDGGGQVPAAGADAASWLERNRRLVQRYQSLVRTAATLDALIDQEVAGDF